jgi:2'-5' RNA ligase
MRKRGSPPVSKNNSLRRLQKRYDELWSDAIGKIRAGKIESDRVLAAGSVDRRRGLTLIARPSAAARERVLKFLRELRRLEPDQHYYPASDLHLTILSPFGATVEHGRFLVHTEKYVAAMDSVLRQAAPIRIKFAGVTASPGAIMIQGFPDTDALNDLRDRLRERLRASGLAGRLEARYRLVTAHMTVARFCAPLRNGEQFAAALEQARQRHFGTTTIKTLTLVKNDWYMSHQTLETLKHYRLAVPRSAIKTGN